MYRQSLPSEDLNIKYSDIEVLRNPSLSSKVHCYLQDAGYL